MALAAACDCHLYTGRKPPESMVFPQEIDSAIAHNVRARASLQTERGPLFFS